MSASVLDGVAIDSWGQEWLLGGWIGSAPHVRWSVEPDVPVGVGELGSMPPGPPLAAWLAALDPAAVCDLDLVDVVGAYRRLMSWAEAGQVRRSRSFLADRCSDATTLVTSMTSCAAPAARWRWS